jgi:hypothetical protein
MSASFKCSIRALGSPGMIGVFATLNKGLRRKTLKTSSLNEDLFDN